MENISNFIMKIVLKVSSTNLQDNFYQGRCVYLLGPQKAYKPKT